MSKWLSGSPGTGNKILGNISVFKYTYEGVEPSSEDKSSYKFDWSFGEQTGYINIIYRDSDGKIEDSSFIDTNNSIKEFNSALGLYKDSTLFNVFKNMMASINIKVNGSYSQF